ncbi:helicase-associated domain-containing protein [Streptomyces sp. RFCAC02]|uniref:helicase-associated domain-containing protein n=1 Tax=Streptomyces sp. RFCAC02 TaxID=2499143 RepID=UPI001021CA1F|nr:helicase-associated domain-containing protein [Streptomyces sp. RFCAC02]
MTVRFGGVALRDRIRRRAPARVLLSPHAPDATEVSPIPTPKSSGPAKAHLLSWLRGLSASQLAELLTARADILRPSPPTSPGALRDRLLQDASVAQAVAQLTRPAQQAAEAAAALGARATEERLTALLDLSAAGSRQAAEGAVAQLRRLALMWPDEDGRLWLVPQLERAWPAPLGLGPAVADLLAERTHTELLEMTAAVGLPPQSGRTRRQEVLGAFLTDPAAVRPLAAGAPPEAARLLADRLRAGATPGTAETDGRDDRVPHDAPGLRWLLEHGLLMRTRHLPGPQLPAEVAAILRGDEWRAPFTPAPPAPDLVPVGEQEVTREAVAALTAFAGHAAAVLLECAARPPERLRSGSAGVGARELQRVARAARCGEAETGLILELAQEAGLLAREDNRFPVTGAYDAWAAGEPAQRVAVLLRAWWRMPARPSRVLDRDGRPVPPLAFRRPRRDYLVARRTLATAASRLPAGRGLRDDAGYAEMIAWYRPWVAQRDEDRVPFASLLAEARLLGVIARGALTPVGAALRSADEGELPRRLRELLPAARDTARLGSDLTAVVTGAPSARLERLLDTAADRESRGTASVWRFGPASVRRALDAGETAENLTRALTEIGGGPLPQPLAYLIDDTARQHGRVRVVGAACVLHAEDAALLRELLYHRGLAALGLRMLAPTVLVSRAPAADALAALRAAGYAPVEEAPDGTVRIERPERTRAEPVREGPAAVPRQRREARRPVRDREQELFRAVARLLESDDRDDDLIAYCAPQLSEEAVGCLRDALRRRRPVEIEYETETGERDVRPGVDLLMEAPFLLYSYPSRIGRGDTMRLAALRDVRPV